MTEFTSEIKIIPHKIEVVYKVLSDLSNLELVKDKIPQDKVKGFSFDQDSCSVNVDPVGDVKFLIVDRQIDKHIKFEGQNLPMTLHMWIEMKDEGNNQTELKLRLEADLNVFIKAMVSKPLQQGIDKVAELLVTIPYNEIIDKRSTL